MVSLFLNLFIIAWVWLTIRLKTKKHNIIRICISLFFVVFNLIAVINTSTDDYIKEDTTAYLIVMIFYVVALVLWSLRLLIDLLFVAKKQFDEKENELSKIIKEKLHINE